MADREANVRDDITELNNLFVAFKTMVGECKQSTVIVTNGLRSLTAKNSELRRNCGNKLIHQESNWLIDHHDKSISNSVKEIRKLTSELHGEHCTAMVLVDEISQTYDTIHSKLMSIEIDPLEFAEEIETLETQFLESKKTLSILQRNINSFQKEIVAWDFAFNNPVVYTISSPHLRELCTYLSGQLDWGYGTTHAALKIFEIYQLKQIKAMRPVTNITVLECWKRIHFALWRVQKGVMNLNGNLWEDRFDDVVDQLQHEICWAITSSELVSVIRSIMGLDTERVNYSAQYLVDFTRPHLRLREREGHYCYTCHVEEALKYVETHGIETQNTRPLQCKANVQEKSSSDRLGYIGNVVKVRGLEAALEVVERHPVATSIPIFEPEYSLIGEKIYRGPTSRLSKYKSMHAGNITGGGVTDDGEKFIWFRSSHGKALGRFGYLKVSVEMMGCCLTRNEHDDFIEHPFPLVSQFVYPEMLSQAEEDGKRRRREEEFRAKKRQKI